MWPTPSSPSCTSSSTIKRLKVAAQVCRLPGAIQLKVALACALLSLASPAQAQFTTISDGVYSAAQAATGRALYQQHCQHCHDHQFFRQSLQSWQGMTVQDYWYRILGNMPADNPRALSDSQYLALVAFILSLAEFPAGERALEISNGLGRIRILAP